MFKILSDAKPEERPMERDQNMVIYSQLSEFYHVFRAKTFTIRYVAGGCEHYTLNGARYSVKGGEYLLANHLSEGHVEIGRKHAAKGVCIGINPQLVSEVLASYTRPDTAVPDLSLDSFFNSPHFLINQFKAGSNALGGVMTQIETTLGKTPGTPARFNREFYFSITEKIVEGYIPVCSQLQAVPGLKQATKTDLLRKLLRGKAYMDEQFTDSLDIITIAREAGISEYHFFRLFKSVYGATPWQYILRLRLNHAYHLLQTGGWSVSAVAIENSFSDIFTFSKAFRKQFGITPSSLCRK